MRGRGRIAVSKGIPTADSPGINCLDEFTVEATMGDYGRNDNPSISIGVQDKYTLEFEFASPDEARKLAERLLTLARTAEDKAGQRGPEFRAKLARDEALIELRDLTRRVELAMGVESPVEGVTVYPSKFTNSKA